jgi:DNA-binding CsgD family transcriptional regulator
MEHDRIDQLTDRERDCLRLVARGNSSKDIAGELGISHHTVDLHLKRAMKALGAATRRDAARLLAARETPADADTQRLVTQSPSLAEAPSLPPISPPDRINPEASFRMPFLRQGGDGNDLTTVQRLGWIGGLALVLLIVIANFFNGLGVLQRLTS